jgi:uncharacterized protein YqeY
MSLIDIIKTAQVEARKARDPIRSSILTTLISEATKVTAEEFKSGKTEITDEKVIKTLRTFVGNINMSLNGDSGKGITPIPNGDAREKLEAELVILSPYIPTELTEAQLRDEVAKMATESGETYTVRDTGKVKAALELRFPGQIDARTLSTIMKEGVAA